MNRWIMPALLLLLPVVGVVYAQTLFWSDDPAELVADRLLEAMSDEEIVAQTLMLGWPAREPTPEIMQWIETSNLGGVKIFGHNGDHLPTLVQSIGSMQGAALDTRHGIPLFIATDQEGGWVRHVKGETAITPGNMAIGASRLPFDAYSSGLYIGRELRALGINMNFAPTLDVYSNPEAHVIGPRSFSDDPISTALLGVAFFRGLERARVIAVGKHFPGHGSASGDSHGTLPIVSDGIDSLWQRDLVPFRFLIKEGIPGLLGAHVRYPTVTQDNAPATFSSYFIDDVLRERLGFEGLIITDDLVMGGAIIYGISEGMGREQLSMAGIRAGNDMVMLSDTATPNGELWQAMLSAYREESDLRSRFRAAARRVLLTKLRYLKNDERAPLIPDAASLARLPDREAEAFFAEQAARSVTIIRDRHIPYRPAENERILLWGSEWGFRTAGRKRYPNATLDGPRSSLFYSIPPEEGRRFQRRAQQFDTIIYCLASPAHLEIVRGADALAERIIVLSTLTPVYLRDLDWHRTSIAVYGLGIDSFAAGFAVLSGDIAARGWLPIEF